MTNYKNGKIYTLRSRNSDKVYVGSTCTELHKRLYHHKNEYKNWVKGKRLLYTSSYEVLKDGMCYIELYEKYQCNDRNELHKREGEVIRSMECVNILMRMTDEDKKKKKKEYDQANKERRNERSKVKITCECGRIVSRSHVSEHKRSIKHKTWENNRDADQPI